MSTVSPSADFTVARSLRSWTSFWGVLERSDPLSFEEGRDMAVLIEAGSRPTAGYAIDLLAAEKKGLFFVVQWRERNLPDEAFVAQVVSTPWLVARLARTDTPVIFTEEGAPTVALPRIEYFAFRSAFPRCATILDGMLPSGVPLFILDAAVMAPFFEDHPACANPE